MSASKASDCKSDIPANRPAHLLSTSDSLSISESTAERYTLADPDVRLMLQVRDGDAQAFEELMLRYQNRLMSLLAHLVGQRDLAEDLTQEVFSARVPCAEAVRAGSEVFDVAVYDRGQCGVQRAASRSRGGGKFTWRRGRAIRLRSRWKRQRSRPVD